MGKKARARTLFETEIDRIRAEGDPFFATKYHKGADDWIEEATALLALGISPLRARLFNSNQEGGTFRPLPDAYWDGIRGRLRRLDDVIEKLNEFEIKGDFPKKWAAWKSDRTEAEAMKE